MPVRHQPVAAGMILLGLERRVAVLDPDFQRLHFHQRPRGDEDFDPLQMVREHRQRQRAFLAMRAINQRWLDVNRPALDVAHNGIEANGARWL